MSNRCSICVSADAEAIGIALAAGESHRAIAGRFPVTKSAIQRHARHMAGAASDVEDEVDLGADGDDRAEIDVDDDHVDEHAVEHEDEVDPLDTAEAVEVVAGGSYMVGDSLITIPRGKVFVDRWVIDQMRAAGIELRPSKAPEIPLWQRPRQPAPPPPTPKPVPIKFEEIPSSLDEAERLLVINPHLLDRALQLYQTEAAALARRGAPQRQLQAMTMGVRDALARAERAMQLILALGGVNALRQFGLTEATWSSARFNEAQQAMFAAAPPPVAFNPIAKIQSWRARGITAQLSGDRLLLWPGGSLTQADRETLSNASLVEEIKQVLRDVAVIEPEANGC